MKKILLTIATLWSVMLSAQSDSIAWRVDLPDATVIGEVVEPDAQFATAPDSALMSALLPVSLGEALQLGTTANLRVYGPAGSLITAPARGLSSDHTALTWKGMPLNSPTLGLVDLGSIPMMLFDDVRMLNGTRSSFTNVGTAGGLIVLDAGRVEAPLTVRAGIDALNNLRYGARLHLKLSDRWRSSTRFQIDRLLNEFSYHDPMLRGRPERLQHHNNFTRQAVLQSFSADYDRLEADAAIWLQRSALNVPELMGSYGTSFAQQRDSSLRINVGLRYRIGATRLSFRTAWFNEQQQYTDRTSEEGENIIDSEIQAERWVNRIAVKHEWQHLELGAAYDLQLERAGGNNFANGQADRFIHGPQLFANYRQQRFSAHFSGRYDHGILGAQPVANLSLNYRVRILRFFAVVKNTFRYADLNERFWQLGGNPNLEPEQGITLEAGVRIDREEDRAVSGQLLVYRQQMHRLIAWTPLEGIWTPVNIDSVQAFGLEGEIMYRFTLGRVQFSHRLQANLQENNIPESDVQKAFYPRLRLRYAAHATRGRLSVGAASRFVSNDFTHTYLNAVNGKQDAVMLFDAHAGYTVDTEKQQITTSIAVQNIGNVLDHRILQVATPGRILSLQITWTWKTI